MKSILFIFSALLFSVNLFAEAPITYGQPINLEQAKIIAEAAQKEAEKNNWPVTIVIVDSGANTVLLHKLNNAQHLSVGIAQGKAETAVNVRAPTKGLQDAVANGGRKTLLKTHRSLKPV